VPHETSRARAIDEQTFLEEETRRTMGALNSEARAIGADLRTVTSVSAWTREHPWLLVGSSAAAGLGAGLGLGMAWWRSPSKASQPARAPSTPSQAQEGEKARTAGSKKSSWLLRAGLQLAGYLAKRALIARSEPRETMPAVEPAVDRPEVFTGAGAAI
jgi:hypothetical protein